MKPVTAAVGALFLVLALACGQSAPAPAPAPAPKPAVTAPAATNPGAATPGTAAPAGAAGDEAAEAAADCCCSFTEDGSKLSLRMTTDDCSDEKGACETDASVCEDFAKKSCCCVTEGPGDKVTKKDSTWGECGDEGEDCTPGACAVVKEQAVQTSRARLRESGGRTTSTRTPTTTSGSRTPTGSDSSGRRR